MRLKKLKSGANGQGNFYHRLVGAGSSARFLLTAVQPGVGLGHSRSQPVGVNGLHEVIHHPFFKYIQRVFVVRRGQYRLRALLEAPQKVQSF